MQVSIVLPPLGQVTPETQGDVVAYLSNLAGEASEPRDEWATLADDNLEIYTYGKIGYSDSDDEITVNEIQNAIIAATDIQTKEPPRAALEPVETGEPPTTYWAGPDAVGIAMGLPDEQVTEQLSPTGAVLPPQPLEPMIADILRQQFQAGLPVMVPPLTVPVPAKPEWLVDVDDRFVADVYQQVFDVLWMRSEVDRFVRDNLLDTNVQGWAEALYEFDDDFKRHIMRRVSIRQVYLDPIHDAIEEMSYVGVDFVVDADEAMALYPALADAIDAQAKTGSPQRPDTNTQLGQIVERAFQRPVVTLRVFWLRNQPCDPVGAALVQGTLIETETGYVDANGAPVDTSAPEWQRRRCLRQITVLADTVADDVECPHADIPILHNVNIPIPGRPWGLGEPFRLKKLQDFRNRVMTSVAAHADYYGAPVVTMSQSMHAALAAEYGDGFVKPGRTLIVEDELYRSVGGKVATIQDPPATPEGLVNLIQLLQGEISQQSGHTDVIRGNAPSANMSGRAIENLQQGATSLIGFKSQRTGDMVRRLSKLMLHCIVTRMEVADLQQIISRYKPHILAAVLNRGRRLEWDVKVSVESGSGNMVAAKKQQAIAEFNVRDPQTGEPLRTLESTREACGIDHHEEHRRWQGQLQQMMGQAQPQQEEKGSKESKPKGQGP